MENNNMTAAEQQEKTFTQEQVNAIVGKRLAEQKATFEADLVKRERELNRREMSIRAKELLSEKGLPKDLSDILRYDNEDDLVKAVEAIAHTRGFTNNEQAQAGGQEGGQKGEYRVLGDNRLPSSNCSESGDPVADAFKMKG